MTDPPIGLQRSASQVASEAQYEPKAPFQKQVYFEPAAGDLVLFPPWLLHRVPPITAGPRVRSQLKNVWLFRDMRCVVWSR